MTKQLNILVTGGGGFVGKHLIEELVRKRHKVTSYDRKGIDRSAKIRVIIGDILDKKKVTATVKGHDVIYHLAGVLGTSELQTKAIPATEVNVIGALHIFDAAVKYKAKVVLISKPNPWLNTYSITKETSEKFCQMYQKDFGLKALIVKWFSIYGPGQKTVGVQKAVPTFIMRALHNQPLPIFGDGTQQADFIYITDAVEATIALAQSPKTQGKIIEVGLGKGIPVRILAKEIIRICDSSSKLQFLPMRVGETPHTKVVANLTMLKKCISFRPHVELETGLQQTIAYYRSQLKD